MKHQLHSKQDIDSYEMITQMVSDYLKKIIYREINDNFVRNRNDDVFRSIDTNKRIYCI